MRGRVSIRRLLLLLLGALALAVVVLNWTYGRLPAEPAPTGSFAQVGNLRIRYIEHRGAGVPVVLIHGLPGTAEDWEDVTPLLAGHRTIAIDRPGYGFSSGGYVPFDRQLEAIRGLLAKLHVRRPILVGHSYGGRSHLDSRSAIRARSVVSCSSTPPPPVSRSKASPKCKRTQFNFCSFRSSGRSPTRPSASSSQRSR
jgi:pimeloyl-ACP methyl ester carboxylesterase